MYNRNAAYDLSVFEQKSKKGKVIRLNIDRINQKRALRKKLVLAMTVSVVSSIAIACAGVYISGQAKISELTEETTRLSRHMQDNDSVYTQLDMKKKTEISKDYMSSHIKDTMGMAETDNLEYINVMDTDKAEINDGNGVFAKLKDNICEFCNNLFHI